jgi:hypothetical protein
VAMSKDSSIPPPIAIDARDGADMLVDKEGLGGVRAGIFSRTFDGGDAGSAVRAAVFKV